MTERLKDAHLSPRFLYLFLRRRRILCASVAVLLFWIQHLAQINIMFSF